MKRLIKVVARYPVTFLVAAVLVAVFAVESYQMSWQTLTVGGGLITPTLALRASVYPPSIEHGEWWRFVLVAVAFSLVNTYLRPILRIVTMPISILTLGIFLLIINAFMLLLVGAISSQLQLGFRVADFGAAFLGAIVVAVVGFILAVTLSPARFAGRMF